MTSGDASTIKFGDGLDVTDEGANVIRVDVPAGRTDLLADLTINALDSGGFPTGAPSQFDITDIPSGYSALLGVMIGRLRAGSPITNSYYRFNGDTGENYYQRNQLATGESRYFTGAFPGDATDRFTTHVPGTIATAGQFAHQSFLIPGYASTTWMKTVQIHNVFIGDDAGAPIFFYELTGGCWNSTAAIEQLTIFPDDFADDSRLWLYGRT